MNGIATKGVTFDLPRDLACPEPTELRGLPRDGVRLLVTRGSGQTEHAIFHDLSTYLQKGDVLVVNTSATRPSALPISLPGDRRGMAHFSTPIDDRRWLIEIREVLGNKTVRWKEGDNGMEFQLPGQGLIRLKRKFYGDRQLLHLWVAEMVVAHDQTTYLQKHAHPIKYDKLEQPYPLDFYQTLFSLQPGSAEMPSAGRGFTPELVEILLEQGVTFAPFLLHSGVSSLEDDEPPYEEYMEVNALSAAVINHARRRGSRILAVGTTAVRAIESAVNDEGEVVAFAGKTSLYIEEDFRMQVIDGLLTGFHEPRASHLKMLQSLAGEAHISEAYDTAIANGYYWHQFGDLHLILP